MNILIRDVNKLDKKLDQVLNLQEDLQRSLTNGLAALRQAMFNMQERQFPSSFVFVEEEPAEPVSSTNGDALIAFRLAVSKFRDFYNIIKDPQTAIENSFKRRVTLMLVCEVCGSPMRPGYKISRPDEQKVGRYLPLARIGNINIMINIAHCAKQWL